MLAHFGVTAARREGFPGVWTDGRKIASLGIAVKKYVTMHGLALNVAEDLSLFNFVTPCGLDGVVATSIARESAQAAPSIDAVKRAFIREFQAVFHPAASGEAPAMQGRDSLMKLLHSV